MPGIKEREPREVDDFRIGHEIIRDPPVANRLQTAPPIDIVREAQIEQGIRTIGRRGALPPRKTRDLPRQFRREQAIAGQIEEAAVQTAHRSQMFDGEMRLLGPIAEVCVLHKSPLFGLKNSLAITLTL
jgi:hypothetical protein